MKCPILAAVLVLACSGNVSAPGGVASAPPASRALLFLSLAEPSLSQPVTAEEARAAADAKFVEVEVAEVVNPQRYALFFDVHYAPTAADRIPLGTFALYPADHPGRFIVPVQGRVRTEGALVLTMTSPDTSERTPDVRAGVRPLRFRN